MKRQQHDKTNKIRQDKRGKDKDKDKIKDKDII
jgi:hypothetical protein